MFFFCLNIILGGFVSYYSNAKMRVNFEYDYNFDDVLNEELKVQKENCIQNKYALIVLGIDYEKKEREEVELSLEKYSMMINLYWISQMVHLILQMIYG